MERTKLLIAEGTEEFRAALIEALQGVYQVRACGEGNEALALLCEFQPELVILDLMLPGLDGITILERALQAGVRSTVLATTRLDSPYILDRVGELGVGYIMRKPCDLRAVIDRLTDLGQRRSEYRKLPPDPRAWTSAALNAMGFSTKLKGYDYLVEAVQLMSRDPKQAMTKELYPAVAALRNEKWDNVERNCREAIEKAWHRGDPYIWKNYFPNHCAGNSRRPTNAEFILRLVRDLPKAEGMEF